jgi:hypothetical protein
MPTWAIIGFILLIVISMASMVLTDVFFPVDKATDERHFRNPFSNKKHPHSQ